MTQPTVSKHWRKLQQLTLQTRRTMTDRRLRMTWS